MFLFYRPTRNIICFVEKKKKYFWGSVCVFYESDTVKSDCPVHFI